MPRNASPVIPLTSLTQSGARATCVDCGSDRVTRIAMTLTDGSPVDFANCQSCERKSWEQDGVELDLPDVLTKARKER